MNRNVAGIFMLPICLWVGSLAAVAAAEPYQVDTGIIGVAVRGRVTYSGLPRIKELVPVVRDNEFCGDTISQDPLVIDPATHGVQGVVVSLEGVEKGKPLPQTERVLTLEIESKTCRFAPRLAVKPVGARLQVRNNDPILHNLHVRNDTRFGPTVLNVIQPGRTTSLQSPFKEPGLLDVRCDVHPFMAAFIHIFDHPYYTTTSDNGEFEMSQVPPGVYKVRLWHETLGFKEAKVKVPPGDTLNLELDMGKLSAPGEAKPAM